MKVWVMQWENRDDFGDQITLFFTLEKAQLAMFEELFMHEREGKRVVMISATGAEVYRTNDREHSNQWVVDNEELLFQVAILEQEVY
jgi:hypothetical protein